MKSINFLFFILTSLTHAMANSQSHPESADGFDDFKRLLLEVEKFRNERLVSLDSFLMMSSENNTIILDTRSDFRYERKHLKHANHLAFTDFTQASLATVIPDLNTRILIYCNNNFTGDQIDFATKRAGPQTSSSSSNSNHADPLSKNPDPIPDHQFAIQAKPTLLALNIPTFITLFGYGYENVYELKDVVNVNDPRIVFEGSIVHPKK